MSEQSGTVRNPGERYLMTVREAARSCGVGRGTIYRWIARGLPVVKVGTSDARIAPDSLADWLKANEAAA